uniref:Uncharacterized protein n=1 Tax=Alexandrium andersonii TaxID=327968 RepID=A0A7S2JG24_9DINO
MGVGTDVGVDVGTGAGAGAVVGENLTLSIAMSLFQLLPRMASKAISTAFGEAGMLTVAVFQAKPWLPVFVKMVPPFAFTVRVLMVGPNMLYENDILPPLGINKG